MRMKNMKGVMLNSHIWCLISDLMIGTFTIPYVFFPLVVGTPLGIFTKLGMNAFVQTYFGVACVGEVGASIVFMFENRQYQTVQSKFKIGSTWSRKLFILINSLVPFTTQVFAFSNIPDQVIAKLEQLKVLPCPTKEYFEYPVIIITNNKELIGYLLLMLVSFYALQSLVFILHVAFYLRITTKSTTMSEKTKKMKQKYFIAVCIQIIVPLLIIAIPVGYFVFSMVTGFYCQKINNFCFLIISVHGCTATISTIFIYENYRIYTLQLLRIKSRSKITLIQSKSMAETTYI